MDAAHAVTRQPRPTTPEDLHRLAALAQARGLRLTQESETVWFCSSASQHVDPHYVTGLSCDCRGFTEDAPALVPAVAQCPNCSGGGVLYVRDCERAGWPHPPCPECQGTGEIPAV